MGKGKKTNIDFSIIISLVDNSTVSKEYKMVYFQGKSKKGKTIEKRDNIQLCDNKITISGHRESSDIFYNLENNEFQTLYSSTLYKNIIKTICNYIILSKKLLFIEKININYNQFSLEFSYEEIYLFSKNEHDINIPGIETVDSDFLFSNNIKSKKFFDSFLYFVQALNEDEGYYKFERLYRALNILMYYQGNTNKDVQALKALTELCFNNNENFTRSISYLFNPDVNIYDKLRWSSFIKNKHNRKNQPIEILTTITDSYLISIILQRRKNLKEEEIEALERNKLNTSISLDQKTEDYLKLILCNYIYFVRCSFFHGELNDAFFHLFTTTKLKDEFDFINSFLVILLIDCYKNFNLFRE